jgi:hypothetical protein
MEKLARKPKTTPTFASPVLRIADDWMPDGRHVGAYLVGAAGLEADAEEGGSRVARHDLEVCSRETRGVASNRDHLAVCAVAPDRRIDRAGAGVRTALHEREVLPFELARADESLKRAMHGL